MNKKMTQAEVETTILDHVFKSLPNDEYGDDDKRAVARNVYDHVWQQSASGSFGSPDGAA